MFDTLSTIEIRLCSAHVDACQTVYVLEILDMQNTDVRTCLAVTLPPIIMEVENGSNTCPILVSFH